MRVPLRRMCYISRHTSTSCAIHVDTHFMHALYIYTQTHFVCYTRRQTYYGVATISMLLKIIGLYEECRSLLQGSFAKETCNFKEPTNRSHSIPMWYIPGQTSLATYVDILRVRSIRKHTSCVIHVDTPIAHLIYMQTHFLQITEDLFCYTLLIQYTL